MWLSWVHGMNRTLTRCIVHGYDGTKPAESVFGINVHDIRALFRNRVYFTLYLLSIHIQGGWDRVGNRVKSIELLK